MQLMPATAREVGLRVIDWNHNWNRRAYLVYLRKYGDERLDPRKNILAGTRYLRIQYDHFTEIPDVQERWKFALAANKGGTDHIDRAIRLAKDAHPEIWTMWEFTNKHLYGCDILEICGYVRKIWRRYLWGWELVDDQQPEIRPFPYDDGWASRDGFFGFYPRKDGFCVRFKKWGARNGGM